MGRNRELARLAFAIGTPALGPIPGILLTRELLAFWHLRVTDEVQSAVLIVSCIGGALLGALGEWIDRTRSPQGRSS